MENLFCPNLSDPQVRAEFEELVDVVGDVAAYDIWDKLNGNGIEKAPNGEPSVLFSELLSNFNGNRVLAIQHRAKNLANSFKMAENGERDVNGEVTLQTYINSLSAADKASFEAATIAEQTKQGLPIKGKYNFAENDTVDKVLQNALKSDDIFAVESAKLLYNTYTKYGVTFPTIDYVDVLILDDTEVAGLHIVDAKTGKRFIKINCSDKLNKNDAVLYTILHEIAHDVTIAALQQNGAEAKALKRLYYSYILRYGKSDYATKNLNEFVAELFGSRKVMERTKQILVPNEDATLWQKIVDWFIKFFGINDVGTKNPMELLERLITNYHDNPNIVDIFDPRLDAQISSKIIDYEQRIKNATTKARVTISDIHHGMKSRILSAAKRAGTLNAERELRNQLRDLESAVDDQDALYKFLRYAGTDFVKPLRYLQNVYVGKYELSDAELLRFNEDIIGFYEPVIYEINALYVNDYFQTLPQEQVDAIGDLLKALMTAIPVMKARYETLRTERTQQALREAGVKAGSKTMDDFVDNSTQTIANDINWVEYTLGSLANVNNEALRAIYYTVENAKHEVEEATREKGRKLIELQSKVSKNDLLLLFERDEKGRKTGYMATDRLYGKMNHDYQTYLKEFKEKHFPENVDFEPYTYEETVLFNKARNKWLAKYAERPMKPEFYQLYEELSQEAALVRDNIQAQISNIYEKAREKAENGGKLNIMLLSDSDYAQLETLLKQKRELANRFMKDGTKKIDIDLQIAEELSAVNKKIQDNIQYDRDIAAWAKERAKVPKNLLPKWDSRNSETVYDQEFWDMLDKIDKKTYGARYEELKEYRSEILKLYRNLNNIEVNGTEIVENGEGNVAKTLEAIDREMSRIRSEFDSQKTTGLKFSDIAEIVPSSYYLKALEEANRKEKVEPGTLENFIRKTSYIDVNTNKRVLYSYWTYIKPKSKKHIKLVPSKQWSEISTSSTWYNNEYDRNNPEYIQPKKEYYDNSKTWNKIKSNQNLMNLREALLETMNESNSKIDFMRYKKNLKLPQISGSLYQFSKSGTAGLERLIKNALSVKPDDADYNTQTPIRPNGSRMYFVPTYYIQDLDNPNDMTNDITGAVIKYFQMAENFKRMNEIAPTIELIHEQLGGAKNIERISKNSNLYKQLVGQFTGNKVDVDRATPYFVEKLEEYMKMRIYGDSKQALEVSVINPKNLYKAIYNTAMWVAGNPNRKAYSEKIKFSLGKVVSALNAWTTTINLMYNATAAVVGLVTGMHQAIIEGIGGRTYNVKNFSVGLMQTIFGAMKYITHFQGGQNLANNKTMAIMEYHQIGQSNSEVFDNLNRYPIFRFLTRTLTWGMWSAGDFVLKGTMMNSIYDAYRLLINPKTGKREFMNINRFKETFAGSAEEAELVFNNVGISLYDATEVENGKLVVKEEYVEFYTKDLQNEITNIGKYLTSRADMIVSTEDKSWMSRNVFGAAVLLHKGWMVTTIQQRFTKKRGYNYQLSIEDEALYRSGVTFFAKYLFPRLRYLFKSKEFKNSLYKLDAVEKSNVRILIAECLSIAAVIAYNNAHVDDWDDDRDNLLTQHYALIMRRLQLEMYAPYNAVETLGMIKSPSASVGVLEQLTFLLNFASLNYTKTIEKGPYKDMPAYQRSLFKATPFKHLIESRDPAAKRNYIENQIMK